MRPVLAVLTLASVVVLIVLTTPGRIATDPTIAEIPDPTTSLGPDSGSRTEASLPDGTQFVVTVAPGVPDDWLGTTGSISVAVDGEVIPVGILEFHRGVPNTSYLYEDGSYRIPAGGILVKLEIDPDVLRRLGPAAEGIVTTAIRGNSESGYPVLRLKEPFGWASDEEADQPMAVRFSSFEVRRGCGELAAACSPEESLQVIWRSSELLSAPPLQQPEVRVFRLVP